MQLFYSTASPFVRKVMVTLIETGQKDAVELIASGGTPVDSSNMPVAQNPLGKLPTLLRPDGPAMFDSRVICRYLDARGKGGLYPDARIWDVLTLEALADGIMDAAVLMVYETRVRTEAQRNPDWVEGQWDKVVRGLDALEGRWMSHLAGPLDMGQIAVGCALGYLGFRHPDRDWRQGRSAIVDWDKAMAARPAMLETRPTG